MATKLWVGQVWGQREDRDRLELQGVVLGDYDTEGGCFINSVLTEARVAEFKSSATEFSWSFNPVTVH